MKQTPILLRKNGIDRRCGRHRWLDAAGCGLPRWRRQRHPHKGKDVILVLSAYCSPEQRKIVGAPSGSGNSLRRKFLALANKPDASRLTITSTWRLSGIPSRTTSILKTSIWRQGDCRRCAAAGLAINFSVANAS